MLRYFWRYNPYYYLMKVTRNTTDLEWQVIARPVSSVHRIHELFIDLKLWNAYKLVRYTSCSNSVAPIRDARRICQGSLSNLQNMKVNAYLWLTYSVSKQISSNCILYFNPFQHRTRNCYESNLNAQFQVHVEVDVFNVIYTTWIIN